jgi:hypothetical protein
MDGAILTNREISALVILLVFIAFLLTRSDRSDILGSVGDVLRLLGKPSLLVPLLGYVAWITAAIASTAQFGLWDSSLLKTTILWLLLSGFALVMRLNDAIEKPGFFRIALITTLGVAAVIEFLSALKSFPLWLELPAQFLAVLLAGVAVVAAREPEQAPVRKFANGCLVIFGLSALIWSTAHLVADWSNLDLGRTFREFLLPIWLTAVALVYVYGFAVLAAYQGIFRRMRIWNKDGPLLRQRLAVTVRANGRLGRLRLLSGLGIQRIARTHTFGQAWNELGSLEDEARLRIEEEAAAKRRLIDNAGVPGTDDSGRQLDQREHVETRNALRWLATCHMGHYRNGEQTYRADLLPIVDSHFPCDGLPENHGIEMYVARDGRRWYATRRAVTDWRFAIGAAGPPPDQWLHDGPHPPRGFPAEPGVGPVRRRYGLGQLGLTARACRRDAPKSLFQVPVPNTSLS